MNSDAIILKSKEENKCYYCCLQAAIFLSIFCISRTMPVCAGRIGSFFLCVKGESNLPLSSEDESTNAVCLNDYINFQHKK